MSAEIQRLSEGIFFELIPNGTMCLRQRANDKRYSFPAAKLPLVEALWSGLKPQEIIQMGCADAALQGWLLSLTELGLIESAYSRRSGSLPWITADGRRAPRPVRPWMHFTLAAWSFLVISLVITQLYAPHESPIGHHSFPFYLLGGFSLYAISILVHEVGHLLAARFHGIRAGRISFFRDGLFVPRFVAPLERELCDSGVRYRIFMAAPAVDSLIAAISTIAAIAGAHVAFYGLSFFPVLFAAFTALPLRESDAAKGWLCAQETQSPFVRVVTQSIYLVATSTAAALVIIYGLVETF